MIQISLEELLPRSGGSVYRLSRMASQRALELAEGRPLLINKIDTDKVTTLALEEIRQGKVVSKEAVEKNPKPKKILVHEQKSEVIASV